MKKLFIFDLDGTLLDTSEGILYCYKNAAESIGLTEKTVQQKSIVIGGPLSDGFRTLYNIESDNQLNEAIKAYKELYKQVGTKKFKVYDGIENLLQTLKNQDFKLAVATLKLEEYAVRMLSSIGMDVYFDKIIGWDGGNKCSKAEILHKVLSELKINPSDAVLVGDSVYDEEGARTVGIDFIGVCYGFGYKKSDYGTLHIPMALLPEDLLCSSSVLA